MARRTQFIPITKDIQSITTFRRRSGDFMRQLRKSKRPVVTDSERAYGQVPNAARRHRRTRTCETYCMAKRTSTE
jgi:hypothetical protein